MSGGCDMTEFLLGFFPALWYAVVEGAVVARLDSIMVTMTLAFSCVHIHESALRG